jgi:hypothetical protein
MPFSSLSSRTSPSALPRRHSGHDNADTEFREGLARPRPLRKKNCYKDGKAGPARHTEKLSFGKKKVEQRKPTWPDTLPLTERPKTAGKKSLSS